MPLTVYSLASTLVWISLSYSGFNAAVYITSEVDQPAINVPRTMLLGTVGVSILYLVLNFGVLIWRFARKTSRRFQTWPPSLQQQSAEDRWRP